MRLQHPSNSRRVLFFCACLLAGAAVGRSEAAQGDGNRGPQKSRHGTHTPAIPSHPHGHAHHGIHADGGHLRSLASYDIPDVKLVDANGSEVSLATLVDSGKPLLLNFIFTSCTTICPVQTATFSQVQAALGDLQNQVRMVSISIDPEQDTPARLRAYAAKFHAGPQWSFLTGNVPDILAVQKAFDAYRGEKASHVPLTFLHASPGASWVRIEGFVSSAELLREYRTLVVRR
jgi:protein SCO1/2